MSKVKKSLQPSCDAVRSLISGVASGELMGPYEYVPTGLTGPFQPKVELGASQMGGFFESGRLVEFSIDYFKSFQDLEPDIVQRFGAPTTVVQNDLQNVYGAKLQSSTGQWRNADHVLMLTESVTWNNFSGGYMRACKLQLYTPERFDAKMRALQAHPNALD